LTTINHETAGQIMARWNINTSTATFHMVLATALCFGATPALADVESGVMAWEAGDFARAVAEWEGSAKAGDADALFNLAQAYRLGRGVDASTLRARELYAAAAAKGHLKAADNYGLLLFQEGEQEKAMPLVRAASDRGDPRAQYVVGLAHFNGDYAQRDWVRAYALMTLAQSAGLPQATGALAQMDDYIPLPQRQQAQSLARKIDENAGSQRAAALAAADLGVRPAAVAAAVPPPRTVPARAVATPPVAARATASDPAPLPASMPETVAARTVTQASQGPLVSTASFVPAASGAVNPARTPAARSGNWRVQLGAFGVTANADKLWNQLSANPALAGTRKALVPGGKVTRLHAVGFTSKSAAEQACAALQRQGQGCLVAGDS
jgi:uncharacterized protein